MSLYGIDGPASRTMFLRRVPGLVSASCGTIVLKPAGVGVNSKPKRVL